MPLYDDKDGGKTRLKRDGTPDRRSPPKKHQFKPKQSGNPNGRPKGSKKIGREALHAALSREQPVREGGLDGVMTLDEIACLQMAKKAANGDVSAFRALLVAKSLTTPATEHKTAEQLAQEKQVYDDVAQMMSTFFVLAGLSCFREINGRMMLADWVVHGTARPSNPRDVTYGVDLHSLKKRSSF
jgi:hypothetical protein